MSKHINFISDKLDDVTFTGDFKLIEGDGDVPTFQLIMEDSEDTAMDMQVGKDATITEAEESDRIWEITKNFGKGF